MHTKSKKILRLLSRRLTETLGSCTVKNNDGSSAKSLAVDSKKVMVSRCITPVSIDNQTKHWSLSTTRYSKKHLIRLGTFPDIPSCSNLNSSTSCDTLSKAFEVSKKLFFTSGVAF